MIGYKLKQLRSVNNFTQEFIAKKLGVSQAYYSNLETGKNKFNKKNLEKLATLYNTTSEEIQADTNYSLTINNNNKNLIGKVEPEINNNENKENTLIITNVLANINKQLESHQEINEQILKRLEKLK